MVDFKGLRDVVIDPMIELADNARKLATELEQFSSETNSQKKALLAVWAGMDAVAAITALAGHSDDYRATSASFKQVDEIVLNLSRQLKWAKESLESAVAMAPSIPGAVNQNGSITINYAALGANPTQAAIDAAQARAMQVQGYMRKALEVATEADTTAQAQLSRLLAEPEVTQDRSPGAATPGGGDSNKPDGRVASETENGARPGTKPSDTDSSTDPGGTGGKPGTTEPGGKPGQPETGGQSDLQRIGKVLDDVGELLSGSDGNEPGERSGLQIIGDALEGIGGALVGDGAGTTPPGDGTIPPVDGGDTTPAPGDGEVGIPTPVPGDGGDATPSPGDETGGTPDPGDGSGSAPGDGGNTNPSPGDGSNGDGSNGDGSTGGDGSNGDGGDNGDPGGVVPAPGGNVEPVGDLNQAQMSNAGTIIAVGESMGISEQGQAIALATAMQESGFRNLANDSLPDSLDVPNEGTGSDHDSVGVFQQRPSQGWGSIAECMNVEHAATSFYTALERVDGWENMSLSEAAQAVQRSAFPDAYAKWEGLAGEILRAHD